jgi:hypothetical protein
MPSFSASSPTARMTSPELVPGAGLPLTAAVVYVLHRITMTGPTLSRTRATLPSGTMRLALLRPGARTTTRREEPRRCVS